MAHHPGAGAPARRTAPGNRRLESGRAPQVRQAIVAPPGLDGPRRRARRRTPPPEAQRAAAAAEIQRVAAAAEAQRATAAAQEAQRSAAQALAAAQTTSTVADSAGGGGWWERTSIGGYGELHYEGGSRDQLDFHRFVLFIGHEFTSRIRFFSEIELEHAWSGEGRPGEVELEQAYVQIDLSDQHRLNAGIMLIPSGFLNEIHEPPTFFGVERNPVETNIIPTTWWEGGIGLSGNFGASGIAYNLMYTSGLRTPLTGANAFLLRSGRQKTGNAIAKAGAVTGELTYTGIAGLELAASGHYEFDVTQGAGRSDHRRGCSRVMMTANAEWRYGGLGFARSMPAGGSTARPRSPRPRPPDGLLSRAVLSLPAQLRDLWRGAERARGLLSLQLVGQQCGHEQPRSRVRPSTLSARISGRIPNVVFKLDYLFQETEAGAKTDRFNAGIGYQF